MPLVGGVNSGRAKRMDLGVVSSTGCSFAGARGH